MPFFGIANHTFPGATGGAAERQLIVPRFEGLEAKDLYPRTGRFVKLQARLYHARVIIDKERIGRDMVADVIESVFGNLAVAVDEEFGMVALRQRILGDAFIRQGVVIIGDIYW